MLGERLLTYSVEGISASVWIPRERMRKSNHPKASWKEENPGQALKLGFLTYDSLLATRVYKAFLFKSKQLQTFLVASGCWVTITPIRSRQARAILCQNKQTSVSGLGAALSGSPEDSWQ